MAFAPSKRKDKALSRFIEQDELNLTPLMDILVVLIPSLLSMAVFTQVAVINFSLPPAMGQEEVAAGGETNDPQTLDITIAVTASGFTLAGTGQVMPPIPKVNGNYDLASLDRVLRAI